MSRASKVLLAAALAAVFAAPLIAQEEKTLQERNVYLFTPDGRMINHKVDDEKQAMILRMFTEAPAGTLAYASAGKLYVSENRKLPDGKMMSEVIADYHGVW
jgi:hypothetical protein